MLKDRGNIKWTSLMLPEHIEKLQRMWEQTEKMKKPILDPQELERMNDKLKLSKKLQNRVSITTFQDGSMQSYQGKVENINLSKRSLTFKTDHHYHKEISFDLIVSVEDL